MKGRVLGLSLASAQARIRGLAKLARRPRPPWSAFEPYAYPGLAIQRGFAENA